MTKKTITEDQTETLHYSSGKHGVGQIPVLMLAHLGLVYAYGEGKYAKDNWKLGTDWSQFIESADRHIMYWKMGEGRDPESGLLHLAHAIWNLTTLMYYEENSLGVDDRDDVELAEYIRLDLIELEARVAAFHAARKEKGDSDE